MLFLIVLHGCLIFLGHGDVVFGEELLHQIRTSVVTAPAVRRASVRHTGDAGRGNQVVGTRIATGVETVLADGENDFLHGLGVLVVVGHEELCVTAIAILFVAGQLILATGYQLGCIRLGLFEVVNLSVGITLGVQGQTCMEQPGSTLIDTTKSGGGVERTDRSQIALDSSQFGIQPVIQVNTFLGNRQCFGCIVLVLEGGLVPKVEEVPIVEGTQEANLGTIELIVGTGLAGSCLQISIEEHYVEAQSLVAPLCALRRGTPRNARNLGYVSIGLPSPVTLVGRQHLQVEGRTIESALTLVAADVSLTGRALLTRQSQCAVCLGQQLHVVVCGRRLRVNG